MQEMNQAEQRQAELGLLSLKECAENTIHADYLYHERDALAIDSTQMLALHVSVR